MSLNASEPFKKKYTFQQRLKKSKEQLLQNPDKIVLIVEKHKKSTLPTLANPRFLCQKQYKFNMIRAMLEKKIKQSAKGDVNGGKHAVFIFINGTIPNLDSTMAQIYEKNKDEDGFLYITYSEHESY